MLEVIKDIGAFAGLAAFFGVAVLALLSFTQGRDIRRLRDWAGSAPERDAERKESTSAAAAERAEEMRRLEEARTEEREAAELRETRRERREAGLPELTRGERLRMALSTEDRSPLALVAAFLAVVVVAGGVAYAVTGGFGGDDGKNGRAASSRSGLHPAEIEVAVLNGTAIEGLAGELRRHGRVEGLPARQRHQHRVGSGTERRDVQAAATAAPPRRSPSRWTSRGCSR